MKECFKSQEVIAQKMMEEALPDAQKIVECTSVQYVPAHSWTLERNKIAKLCGEPECKRKQVECELSNNESVAGEFITGSKGQMILLKEEILVDPEFHVEALLHEWAHAYCEAAEEKESYIPAEYHDGRFPNDELRRGYSMWKEFAAQGICKKICAVNGLQRKDSITEELRGYLEDLIYNLAAENQIGYFFADLFFDCRLEENADRKQLLRELLKRYDVDIQSDFLELYSIMVTQRTEKEFWKTTVDYLEELGEIIGRIKFQAMYNAKEKEIRRLAESFIEKSSGI